MVREAVPAGYVRAGRPPFGTHVVSVESDEVVSGRDFDNVKTSPFFVEKVSYKVTHHGVTKTFSTLNDHVKPGDTVEALFTVPAGKSSTVSLASYKARNSSSSRSSLPGQTLFDAATQTFGAGVHSLTVAVPETYFQVDFVGGSILHHFGPIGTNVTYSEQHRLLSSDHGPRR